MNLSGIVAEIETTVEEGPINQVELPPRFLDMRKGEALDTYDTCQVFGHAWAFGRFFAPAMQPTLERYRLKKFAFRPRNPDRPNRR